MNGLLVAGITASATIAAVLCWAIRWALDKKNLMPTVRLLLNLAVGSCIVVAFGAWIVQLAAWLRNFGTGDVSAIAAFIVIAVPAVLSAICLIFVLHSLHPKRTPGPEDEKAALILPIALMLVAGMLGAVGDGLSKGTSDIAVNLTAMLVGGNGKPVIPDNPTAPREATTGGR